MNKRGGTDVSCKSGQQNEGSSVKGENVEGLWNAFNRAVSEVAEVVCGRK